MRKSIHPIIIVRRHSLGIATAYRLGSNKSAPFNSRKSFGAIAILAIKAGI